MDMNFSKLLEIVKDKEAAESMRLQRVRYTLVTKEQHSKGRKSSTHKYDIKTSNKEKRVQMQDFGNAFEI